MIPRLFVALALFGLAIATFGQAVPATKHPFSAQDWAELRSARAVAVAPKTGAVLYAVSFGSGQGSTITHWWMADRNGGDPHELNLPQDFTPMGFTLHGDALYGSYRAGKLQQFAVFSLHSTPQATPSIVVMLPRGIQSAAPSPDGSHYAILFDPRPPDPLAGVRTVVEAGQTSIYILRFDGTGGQLWCKNLARVSEIAWSPDSASLAVLSTTPRIGFHSVGSFLDVCNRSGARRIAEIPNASTGIAWTNGHSGGKEIAFLSTTTQVLTPDHVWTVAVTGGTAFDRTPSLQGSAMRLTGDSHGHVWVAVNRGVRSEVDEFSNGTLATEYTWSAGSVQGTPVFSRYAGGDDFLALTVGDPAHASNVAITDKGKLRKITHEGEKQLATIVLGQVRALHWTAKDGTPLEGIATFPADYVAGRKYKFLVLPHGGPESNDTLVLNPMARVIAGDSYVVLQPEYRGSTGYGSKFMDAIYQDLGDVAYHDVESATDYAIAQGWADPNRLAIFGWSAGGFMTAWTVTQTNRYKAAIEGAGITDWRSFIWTSDIEQIDYDARWPEENPDAFRRYSAVYYATRVTTPLLILDGEADKRVPMYQGLEYFQILAAHGKTTRMVTYPGSPHFPVLWQQRLDVMQEVHDWLARYNP